MKVGQVLKLCDMQHLKELGANIWLRYVDDIFATIFNKQRAIQILSFLNEQHPNIRFTIEFEKNNELSFLDTLFKRSIGKYYTAMFQKKVYWSLSKLDKSNLKKLQDQSHW